MQGEKVLFEENTLVVWLIGPVALPLPMPLPMPLPWKIILSGS